jgi:hypothetical protein
MLAAAALDGFFDHPADRRRLANRNGSPYGFAFWFAAALPATNVSGLLVASFRKA